ncbi:MAG: hypothetical protein J0L72_11000 [Armatimonadetes bacterium]|nr:hypothetical protein [Armatimonadota bacterium]
MRGVSSKSGDMADQTIFTLDGRDNIMFDVLRSDGRITDEQMNREINWLVKKLKETLIAKGVPYESLKKALIPQPGKREAVFVFDSTKLESSWYGYPIFERLIPCFDRRSTHSVLAGDYIGDNHLQDMLFKLFEKHVELRAHCDWKHSSQFFLVYINNLSDEMFIHFRSELDDFEPYVGSMDLTVPSIMKTYLSMILCNAFIKAKRHIVVDHGEEEYPIGENVNMPGYPFEENGYSLVSIQSMFYGPLLSYKIEREVFKGFESDTTHSLNAVSPMPMDLKLFDVHLEPAKYDYLITKKSGLLKKAGLARFPRELIEEMIAARIQSNYIYNLTYLEEHNTVKFNILLDIEAPDTKENVKLTVSLEYLAIDKRLRVITVT